MSESHNDAGERYYHFVTGGIVDACKKCKEHPFLFKHEEGGFFLACEKCERFGLPNANLVMAICEWNKIERSS